MDVRMVLRFGRPARWAACFWPSLFDLGIIIHPLFFYMGAANQVPSRQVLVLVGPALARGGSTMAEAATWKGGEPRPTVESVASVEALEVLDSMATWATHGRFGSTRAGSRM